jgi:hypothetical protein
MGCLKGFIGPILILAGLYALLINHILQNQPLSLHYLEGGGRCSKPSG